jgi:hypothetical protein
MGLPLTGAGALGIMREKVDPVLYSLFEHERMWYTLLEKQKHEDISLRPYRVPLQMTMPGQFSGYTADGGDMGLGSGMDIEHAEVYTIGHKLAVSYTQLLKYATDSGAKSVIDGAKLITEKSLETIKFAIDATAQGPGNGQLGVIQSVAGAVATMAIPNGAAGVYEGMQVNIVDSLIANLRNPGGPLTIIAIDTVESNTITFSANLPGTVVAGDLIVDTFIVPGNTIGLYGIKYHQNNNTTGFWQNLDRSAFPYRLRTSRVNGGGSALLLIHVLQILAKIRKSIGADAFKKGKYMAYCNTEQEEQYKLLGIQVQSVIKQGPGKQQAEDLDLLYEGDITMQGIPVETSIRADQTRIDFMDMRHFFRVITKDLSFLKDPEGRMIWPKYGASGGITTEWLFYYDVYHQVGNTNPLAGGYIDALATPQIY